MATQYGDFRVRLDVCAGGAPSLARGRGAVASVAAGASELAREVLQNGGNAFDAAFTLAFALCVYHPQAGNLGGGGYLVYKERGARPRSYSFREQAPAAARREDFLRADGTADPEKTAFGPTSVCVPGTVKAFFTLQARHGALAARDLLSAVAARARSGVAITRYEAECLNRLRPKLAASPESRRFYVKDVPFAAGDMLANLHLAKTLEILAHEGEAAFYRGAIAELLVRDLTENGGFMTAHDLAAYELREPDPIRTEFCGREIWTVPPEGGGALLLDILNIIKELGPARLTPKTAAYHHALAEAAKLAFIDRLSYLGDTDLDASSVYRGIRDGSGAAARAALLRGDKAQSTDALAAEVSGADTTHFSVIDAQGNAVSCSYTMNLRYGSKWSIEGAGFLVNGSIDSFAFAPGTENYFGIRGSEANLFAPKKRPASNMAPVLVTRDGEVELVLGSPGGPMIPTTLAGILVAHLAHDVPLEACIAAPRFHHQGWPEVLYTETALVAPEVLTELSALGHLVKDKGEPMGDVHAVRREGEGLLAVSDARREGKAAAHD